MSTYFAEKNRESDLTGFLMTNGKAVMQLLEGPEEAVKSFRALIERDPRHHTVVTEVWELEKERAYPHWSMRFHKSSEFESLFREIECAKMETLAINIARLLFDVTFDD